MRYGCRGHEIRLTLGKVESGNRGTGDIAAQRQGSNNTI